jgi:hypothetical protein
MGARLESELRIVAGGREVVNATEPLMGRLSELYDTNTNMPLQPTDIAKKHVYVVIFN